MDHRFDFGGQIRALISRTYLIRQNANKVQVEDEKPNYPLHTHVCSFNSFILKYSEFKTPEIE